MLSSACAILFWAVTLSAIGAIAMRIAAAVARLRARFVLGLGPTLRSGAIEIRAVPVWVSTALEDAPRGERAVLVRVCAPLAILLAPFLTVVFALVVVGVEQADESVPAVVGVVVAGSPAEEAGVEVGDVILRAGDRDEPSFADLAAIVRDGGGQPVTLAIARGGVRRRAITLVPRPIEGTPRIGVGARTMRRTLGVWEASAATLRGVATVWTALVGVASGTQEGELVSGVGVARAIATNPTAAGLQLGIAVASLAPLFALFAALQQIVLTRRRSAPRGSS